MFALDGSAVGSIPIPMSEQVDTHDSEMLWDIAAFWFWKTETWQCGYRP